MLSEVLDFFMLKFQHIFIPVLIDGTGDEIVCLFGLGFHSRRHHKKELVPEESKFH